MRSKGLGGYCQYCTPCHRGLFHLCENQLTPGLSCDGGYAEYVIMCHPALINILSELSSVHAASVFCAGSASFNALRTSGAMAGDKVATYPSDCQGYQRWRDDHWTSMSGRVCLIHSLLVPWCRLNKDARSIRIDD
ncbi:alcohol dehydrogenase catalytic domain-containing protein [Yersinia sp. 2544 StPb PI]